jgi:hypothetical protein
MEVCGDTATEYGDAEKCISPLRRKAEIESINTVVKNFY